MRWMGLLTKIGRLFMRRLHLQRVILGGTLMMALGACAHEPTKITEINAPVKQPSPPPQLVLLQEARTEADNLRGEMASLKILMAKQAGELRSLRKQSQSIQHREQNQGRTLQKVRSELLSSQAERDQLRKQKMELEVQVASMPDTSQMVSDIQGLHGSIRQIMASIKGLISDITLIKQEMHITPNKGQPRQTKVTSPKAGRLSRTTQTPSPQGSIVIQDGDTLWGLSGEYGVSVEQLREWNGLKSDLIVTGNRLKVAIPAESRPSRTLPLPTSTTPTVKKKHPKVEVQNQAPQAEETPVDIPSEPSHILSIGSPDSDSHESP